MLFSHDTEHSLACAVDLVNSAPTLSSTEQLHDLAALTDFVQRHSVSEIGRLSGQDLVRGPSAAHAVRAVFDAADEEAGAAAVNALVSEAGIKPRLTDHDGYPWHIHYFSPGAGLAEHLATDCGMALAQVVSSGEWERLRHCDGPRLRPGARRPVPQPVQALLRRPDLRQPAPRRRLPRTSTRRHLRPPPALPPGVSYEPLDGCRGACDLRVGSAASRSAQASCTGRHRSRGRQLATVAAADRLHVAGRGDQEDLVGLGRGPMTGSSTSRAPRHSRSSARLMPARQPAASVGVRSSPSTT